MKIFKYTFSFAQEILTWTHRLFCLLQTNVFDSNLLNVVFMLSLKIHTEISHLRQNTTD